MPPRRRSAPVGAALVVVGLSAAALGACGGGGDDVGEDRAAQMRAAAVDAGLSPEVADALALSARAGTATFQVSYAGEQGARLVLSQSPPDRRFDVVQGQVTVSSRVLHDGVAYRCEADTARGAKPGALSCQRAAGAIDPPGTFTDEAVQQFIDQVRASKGTLDMAVDHREVAGVDATCVTTTPKAGTELDGTGPGTDVLCLSDEGAQLLVDHDGQRLVADHYSTTVPEGTFDV